MAVLYEDDKGRVSLARFGKLDFRLHGFGEKSG